jgi:hypothetical protein
MHAYFAAVQRWIIKSILVLSLSTSMTCYAENPFKLAKQYHTNSGKFVLVFETPKKDVYQDIKTIFESSGVFDSIIDGINKTFVLPEDITVKFMVGDGPAYFPNKNMIQMSYDFIFHLTVLYVERYPKSSDDDMLNFALRATTFLFYHELAHAFIDTYQLPIVSNEETAADNLAVILALEYTNDGFQIVMDSAELFDLLEKDGPKKYDESDYWDEHALDAQRFYNILCLSYGRYPEKVAKVLKSLHNKTLSKFINDRGEYCIDEYQRQYDAWTKLLTPYFR